jgi:uncharacterized protein
VTTSQAGVRLRPIEDADVEGLAALNDAEVPRVGHLGVSGLRAHLPRCAPALVAVDDEGRHAGFVLALPTGVDYPSVNYRWFEDRGVDHLYVDRIVVAPHARRGGVAGMLYAAVERAAEEQGRAEVTCEVNIRPRNEPSLAFHAARGYAEVGRQETDDGDKTVVMLARPVR